MDPGSENVSNGQTNPVEVKDGEESTTTKTDSSPAMGKPRESDSTSAKEGDADDDIHKRASIRESIRARLRAQENRLSSLVRNASGDDSMLGQMRTVQSSLQKMEAEKSELEKELNRLKTATDGDEFLKEKMAGIQEGFDKQVETIQSLQTELNQQNAETERLRAELVKKLQRIVELEFDLETHEIHYTSYAKEQFKLGEEALAEIKTKDSGDSVSSSSSAVKNLTPKKAQKLISKLLSDLDSLELRYKEEKLASESAVEKIRIENEDLKTQIESLKNRLGEGSEDSDAEDDSRNIFERQNIYQLRKSLDRSEAKKNIYRKEIQKLQAEVDILKTSSSEDAKRAEIELEKLQLESGNLKARIAQLEAKPKSSGGGLMRKNKKDDPKPGDVYRDIEKRVQENYENMCRLQTAVEIKDKQISTLKKEVANLRMKDISDGHTKDSLYTEFDTNLLRSSPSRSSVSVSMRSVAGPKDDTEYVAELKKQLQEAQQQLVKKDQELVIERAKAASTAAGLLARITELTGKKVDMSQKQVPHRFYL